MPIRRYAEQKGVSVRTIHRWAEAGIIQEPERINGRNYLPADVEPRRDGEDPPDAKVKPPLAAGAWSQIRRTSAPRPYSPLPPLRKTGLPTLAAAIVREHDCAHAAASTAIAHVLRCGELLTEAKVTLPHGKWEKWLKQNTKIMPRTARAYMQIAALDPAKRQRVAELPMREALKAVAQHKYLPDDERAEVRREEDRQKYNAWCRKHGHPERPAPSPAVVVEGPPRPSAPPLPPPTPEEIADGIIAQLDAVLWEAGGAITIAHLRAAFHRRYGLDDGIPPFIDRRLAVAS